MDGNDAATGSGEGKAIHKDSGIFGKYDFPALPVMEFLMSEKGTEKGERNEADSENERWGERAAR